ncbi:hypothetical protein [Spongiactinospora sp. TRM90649]|uniref:hypothetical protein n=1 Tax=Spongiactinospora sp. TRM90649 TaxID=3031114 RepID=UPI0023F7DCDE|nr:hypothetical protein [Spongiactinospora sp. TRM90649]MDF5754565.1 hypothetical protein [Spongiactinospora sp. TRM90649]
MTIAAILLTALLAVPAVGQAALAAGAPLGHFAWGGRHRVLPTAQRIGSVITIPIYAVIALIALDRAGLIDVVADSISTAGTWVIFGYFVLGTAMNAISRSKPERYAMTPTALALAVLALLVGLG